jgi:hypothetical protein
MMRVKRRVKQNRINGQGRSNGRMKIENKSGAGDGIRTRDVLLGRQALCH